jgi:hypothetical protein
MVSVGFSIWPVIDEPARTAHVPGPPDFLMPAAKTEWLRLADEAYALGLLTVLDHTLFAVYCQSVGRWLLAKRWLSKAIADAAADSDDGSGLVVAILAPLASVAASRASRPSAPPPLSGSRHRAPRARRGGAPRRANRACRSPQCRQSRASRLIAPPASVPGAAARHVEGRGTSAAWSGSRRGPWYAEFGIDEGACGWQVYPQ